MKRPNVELVLYYDSRRIGEARAYSAGDHDVVSMFVEPKFRGRNIGRQLNDLVKVLAELLWPDTRFGCDCALNLRERDQVEKHQRWCRPAWIAKSRGLKFVNLKITRRRKKQ